MADRWQDHGYHVTAAIRAPKLGGTVAMAERGDYRGYKQNCTIVPAWDLYLDENDTLEVSCLCGEVRKRVPKDQVGVYNVDQDCWKCTWEDEVKAMYADGYKPPTISRSLGLAEHRVRSILGLLSRQKKGTQKTR